MLESIDKKEDFTAEDLWELVANASAAVAQVMALEKILNAGIETNACYSKKKMWKLFLTFGTAPMSITEDSAFLSSRLYPYYPEAFCKKYEVTLKSLEPVLNSLRRLGDTSLELFQSRMQATVPDIIKEFNS